MSYAFLTVLLTVDRRIGGLESTNMRIMLYKSVDRRIGGLEIYLDSDGF